MATPSMDISQLSEEQQLALQQYTSVTDQGTEAAIPLLQRSQWNVQIAIARFFDGEGPDPVAEALAEQNVPPPRAPHHENLQESLLLGSSPFVNRPRQQNAPDEAPRVVPQPDDQAIQRPPLLLSVIYAPFGFLYKLLSSAFRFFSYLFPFLPRTLRPTSARSSGTGSAGSDSMERKSLKPRDAAARLKREFEEEYGENSLPFYEGGYAQAMDLAKKELKFLLVILTSREHDDTDSFLRDTILSPEVQTFLNNPVNEIVLWVGDVVDSEAYQVATALRCTKFPFTALISHTPQQSSTSMSILTRLTGPMPQGPWISKLQAGIAAHQSQLQTAREARDAQDFERTLRREQDSAYERSLAQDRERARVKKEAEAAAALQAEREREQADAAAALAQKREQWKQWRAQHTPAEPSADSKDVVRIALKMPEAARVTRRFPTDAPIEELYAFVDCYAFIRDGETSGDVSEPTDYTHAFDFRLVSTLPRVVYDLESGGTVGERVGKSGNLIVEHVEGDEEE